MVMEKAAKQQICSKLCSGLGTSLPILLVLVLYSFFIFFSMSGSFPFLLTIPIALLSTLFFVKLTKKKGSQDENQVQDKLQKEELQPSLDVTQTEVNHQSETAVSHGQQAEAESESDASFPSDSESSNCSIMNRTFELSAQKHKQQVGSQSDSSLPSDSESSAGSIMGESFEIDHNRDQNVGFSDSLASDNDDDDEEEEKEDSLIEINLPNSHFSGLTEEPMQKLESKLPDFLLESIFKEQGLMELLAEINEMNEDENLIEIDIFHGRG